MQSRQTFRSKEPRSRTKSRRSVSPLAAHCLQVVDICLLGVLFLAPLFFGGRHLLGRLVFIVLGQHGWNRLVYAPSLAQRRQMDTHLGECAGLGCFVARHAANRALACGLARTTGSTQCLAAYVVEP